jgi:hypothetical protein
MKISRFKESVNNKKHELDYLKNLNEYFEKSLGTNVEKLQNFTKYVPRQDLTNFLARYELFKKILHVPGSIIECGILFGGGLMAFAQLTAIFEHTNLLRKIIGFDTFSGFPKLSRYDKSTSEFAHKGGYGIDSYEDLKKCIELYDANRFLNHISNIELVKGDAVKTIPKFIKKNTSLVVSLLYIDFVLYEPTKIALQYFIPRMPKGAIVAFNLINDTMHWPGTTKALLDSIGLQKIELKKFQFTPYTQYFIV